MRLTNRHKWEFMVPLSVIKQAAERKEQYHLQRYAHWTEERNTAMDNLKEHGLILEEDELAELKAMSAGTYVASQMVANSYRQHTPRGVQIDPQLNKKVTEADAKMAEHKGKLEEIRGWVRALRAMIAANGLVAFGGAVPLRQADFDYFRLLPEDFDTAGESSP